MNTASFLSNLVYQIQRLFGLIQKKETINTIVWIDDTVILFLIFNPENGRSGISDRQIQGLFVAARECNWDFENQDLKIFTYLW